MIVVDSSEKERRSWAAAMLSGMRLCFHVLSAASSVAARVCYLAAAMDLTQASASACACSMAFLSLRFFFCSCIFSLAINKGIVAMIWEHLGDFGGGRFFNLSFNLKDLMGF